MTCTVRISHRSAGQLDPKNWLNEGDGLLASAVKTREIWTNHRQTFSQALRERALEKRDRSNNWNLLTGLPRASMLLLGYSVEMYLKAGLAKAYYGCSEQMFQRDIRERFGHKLISLANEIVFPLNQRDHRHLDLLRKMIVVDARYPVFVPHGVSYTDALNDQTEKVWSSQNFKAFTELANRIQNHSRKLDSDSKNPTSLMSVNMGDDGYLAVQSRRTPPTTNHLPLKFHPKIEVQDCFARHQGALPIIPVSTT